MNFLKIGAVKAVLRGVNEYISVFAIFIDLFL
jgi:hypothetical protein